MFAAVGGGMEVNMSIYNYKVKNVYEEEMSLEEYRGKVVLIINSATRCGFTPQYDELQDLYEKYGQEGFVILDFPCNQFGAQAPEEDKEIVAFCDANFGIKFPIFSKIDVNGEDAHPLFQYLVQEKGFGGFDEEHELTEVLDKLLSEKDPNYRIDPSIKWNFTKFLIDREGNVIARYEPTTDIYEIEQKIKELIY